MLLRVTVGHSFPMESSYMPLKPRQRIKVHEAAPYLLPKGLSEGQEVTIDRRDVGHGVFVRDESGTEFSIPVQCAERESIYLVDGRWRREQHPLVVQWFREQIIEHEASRANWPSGVERAKEWFLNKARQLVAEADLRAQPTTDEETGDPAHTESR